MFYVGCKECLNGYYERRITVPTFIIFNILIVVGAELAMLNGSMVTGRKERDKTENDRILPDIVTGSVTRTLVCVIYIM